MRTQKNRTFDLKGVIDNFPNIEGVVLNQEAIGTIVQHVAKYVLNTEKILHVAENESGMIMHNIDQTCKVSRQVTAKEEYPNSTSDLAKIILAWRTLHRSVKKAILILLEGGDESV